MRAASAPTVTTTTRPRPVRAPTSEEMGASARPSLANLVHSLSDDVTGLVRAEVGLARAEVAANVAKLGRPVIFILAAALLGVAALFTLMGAAVGFLTPYVGAGWAALIVAAVVGIVAFVLFQSALASLKQISIAPKRAIAGVKTDVAMVKDSI